MNEPFFAALSRRIDKKPWKAIPTAGVRVNPVSGHFEMVYNPDFFAKLTDVEKAGVLKHEFYHLVFEHVTGRLPEEGMSRLWNFATDLAINSHLQGELPKGCLMPGEAGTPFETFSLGLSAEQYLVLLRQKQEEEEDGEGEGGGEGGEGEGGEPGEGGDQPGEDGEGDGGGGSGEGEGGEPGEGEGDGSGEGEGGEPGEGSGGGGGGSLSEQDEWDNHDGWGGEGNDTDNTANEIAKQRLKEAVKKAAEEANKAGSWGTVPSECRKEIMDKLTATVDWKKLLRYFIKTSQRANRSSTVKRINRRYRYIHPGKKVNRVASIAISIDQSGSVSDSMLAKFYIELNKLSDLATFTVIPFDTEVAEDHVYVWKKGETRTWERVRCGGTDFDPPTKYVNERQFDGHICLTDLCAPKPIASKCQRLWMTDEYHAKHPYFETRERIVAIT
jgi:predicted metal-dependent peptidase